MDDERATALVREIEEAFAGVNYPGHDRLVYDPSGRHLECAEVADALRGRDWRELSVEELRYSPGNLNFMTAEAVHFYLPAYLRAVVLSYDEAGAIPETILSILRSPVRSGVDAASFRELVARLTPRQKAAIKSFLEFLREEHGNDFLLWEELAPDAVLEAWR